MKSELITPTQAQADQKTASELVPARARRGKRRSLPASGGAIRFFLSKSDNNGVPVPEREFASEGEAIVESLKTGKSYFVISEWKGFADLSKKVPLIRKEAVTHKKEN
jgi:hypothetical protein